MSTFCPLPWSHLATHPDGKVTLCCESQSGSQSANGKELQTLQSTKFDFIKIMNSDNFKRVRLDMLENKQPAECKKCYKYEALGNESKRIREIKRLEFNEDQAITITKNDGSIDVVDFEFVELRLGNHCNLACRTCNPTSSTKWKNDYIKLNPTSNFNFLNQNLYDWPLDDEFWSALLKNSSKIKHIYINGGEPLLIDKHLKFLQDLVSQGLSKNISLTYSTNATVISTLYDTVWAEFKSVKLMLSIDDLAERNYYIRHPANWSKILEFIHWMRNLNINNPSISFFIMQTISIFNVLYITEFYDYFKHRGIHVAHNYVYDPGYYKASNLPDDAKEIILKQSKEYTFIEELRNFLSTDANIVELEKFKTITKSLDTIRGQDFSKVFPELDKILSPDNKK